MGATEEYAMRSALDGARFEAEQHAAALLEARAERDRLRGLVEQARYCVTAALNCSAHPWHGSDDARRWLMRASALSPESNPEGQ